MSNIFKNIRKVCVHNGTFHMDELISLVLCFFLGLREDVEIVRTRNPKEWESDDTLVLDLGRTYDGVRFFDHHQDGSPVREKYYCLAERDDIPQTPHCTAGIIWRDFGHMISEMYVGSELSEKFFRLIDKKLVMPIDFDDNGVELPNSPQVLPDLSFEQMITAINFSDPNNDEEQMVRFKIALGHLKDLIRFYFEKMALKVTSEEEVRKSFEEAISKGSETVFIPSLGWKSVLQGDDSLWERSAHIKAAVGNRGEGFAILMMPLTRQSPFDMRYRIPMSLKDEFSEIEFIHKNGFMCVLNSLEHLDEIIGKLEKVES